MVESLSSSWHILGWSGGSLLLRIVLILIGVILVWAGILIIYDSNVRANAPIGLGLLLIVLGFGLVYSGIRKHVKWSIGKVSEPSL